MTVQDQPVTGQVTYSALRKVARQDHDNFAQVLMRYKLERTLARLAASSFGDRFVLKGGLLLAAYSARRPTKDIDSMLRDLSLDEGTVRQVCAAITDVKDGDGLVYDLSTLKIVEIREEAEYTGFRATMRCILHTDTQPVSFDFTAGDPIDPPAQTVVVPGVLGQDVQVKGYPPSMIVAEKFVTALQRGDVNTRWRDFTDIGLLGRVMTFQAADLRTALVAVAEHRGMELTGLASALALGEYGIAAQTKYGAWVRRHSLQNLAPATFDEALAQTVALVDPVASGEIPAEATWDPKSRAWSTQA